MSYWKHTLSNSRPACSYVLDVRKLELIAFDALRTRCMCCQPERQATKEDEPRSPGTEGARYQSNETSSFGPTVGNGSSDGSNKATPDSSRKASEHSQSADATGAQRAAEEAANRAQQAASQARKHMTQAAKRTTEFVQAVAGEMFSRAQPGQGSQEKAGATASQSSSGAGGTKSKANEATSGSAGAKPGKSQDGHGSSGSSSGFASRFFDQARRFVAGSKGQKRSSSSSKASTSEGADKQQNLVTRLRREVAEAVLPMATHPSFMKQRTDVEAVDIQVGEGPTDLVVSEAPKSWMDRLAEQLGNNPLMDRIKSLRDSEAARRMSESFQDVKEKLEHSENEMIGRMHDMRQRFTEENEAAVAYREIRMRHPSFDMPTFLRSIKQDVPVVIKAYIEGSEDILREYCSDTMVERLVGIHKVTVAEGQISDSTILEHSDVDMIDIKMIDNDPVIILHFSCQQINCVRDQYGNVTSGAPDDVNRVYYYWAVQQDGHGMVTKDGEYIAPRWKLTEMLLRGMHQLL